MSNTKWMNFVIISIALVAIAIPLSGCTDQGGNATQTLMLATTTSVNDSGLLNYLLPDFERANNVDVQVISAGSGQAIAYGASGDVDVLIVHSPKMKRHSWNRATVESRTQIAHNFYAFLVGRQRSAA